MFRLNTPPDPIPRSTSVTVQYQRPRDPINYSAQLLQLTPPLKFNNFGQLYRRTPSLFPSPDLSITISLSRAFEPLRTVLPIPKNIFTHQWPLQLLQSKHLTQASNNTYISPALENKLLVSPTGPCYLARLPVTSTLHLDQPTSTSVSIKSAFKMLLPEHCPMPDCDVVLSTAAEAESHSLAHPGAHSCTKCPLVFPTADERRKHSKEVHQPAVQLAFNGAKYKLYRQLNGTFACPALPCPDGTSEDRFASAIPINMQNHWNRRHRDLHPGFLASPELSLDFTVFAEDKSAVHPPAIVIDLETETSLTDPTPSDISQTAVPETFPFTSLDAEAFASALSPVRKSPEPVPRASVEDYESDEEDGLSAVGDLDDPDADFEEDEDPDASPFPAQKRAQARSEQAIRIAKALKSTSSSSSSSDPIPSSPIRSDHDLFMMGYVIHVDFHVAIFPPLPQKIVDAVVTKFEVVSPPQAKRLPISSPVPYLQPPAIISGITTLNNLEILLSKAYIPSASTPPPKQPIFKSIPPSHHSN
ncbi:hypothetical protein SISSUDRAFT_1067827 [Sistotremastrum suecicum HHB10207 ss-3]|uniref:C2H2-type domain-containing protein n=1 Tax=Sistotremastrum suecicum HHB10207 ss-3 TaxID=1314776 RepID=A0A165WN91_9AGAM|nr:hypothetical protein SISSUDRAFT_1067827 [Sistotremastrum suecicum HHB10207 ss-3]